MTETNQALVGLVGCASQKLHRAAPARDLYVSQLFRKASAYAEATCDRWYVLSAKHGLVDPDTVLEPYDVRLGVNRPSSPVIWDWAAMVKTQLEKELEDVQNPVLLALAGEAYRTVLRLCEWPNRVPMAGMGIGQSSAGSPDNSKEPALPETYTPQKWIKLGRWCRICRRLHLTAEEAALRG